jgi:DNA-binding SARP family transcriptional activator
VEFRILGPLEVREGDVSLTLGGPRERALLAILLTRANEVVSRDALIDQLWGESPPQAAVNVLQTYVSHLRKAIGADVLVTRPPGYVIELEPGQLDLHRFERLLEQARETQENARPDVAATALREALALWRGPALADFAYEPFAQAEIARLEELRLAALDRRIEADLALGRHDELVGELEALVKRNPLRERPRAQLMLALYRSGRQAEALEAFQEARQALVEGLGIEPGPMLRDLERSILRQDRSLELGTGETAAGAPADEQAAFPERSILLVPSERWSLDPLLALAEPLARRPPRELILALLVDGHAGLGEDAAYLESRRAALLGRGVAARAAVFTTADRAADIVLLGSEEDVDLVLVDAPARLLEGAPPDSDDASVLDGMPCDVGMLVARAGSVAAPGPGAPVLVPFGGAEHEWAAVELGAWLASAHGAELRLLGTTADRSRDRRDASRLLARAALMVQRVVGVATEPVLVPAGDAPVIEAAEPAGLLLVGLSPRWRSEGLGPVRLSVVRNARPATLLVRRGLRPGGIAPPGGLTSFTWTLASALPDQKRAGRTSVHPA